MSRRIKLFPVQILAIGFGLIILIGGVLLSLPICSKTGEGIPFINGLFTSTSATCVTGLAVYDTYTQFNFLGQLIILILIQVGGLGFMGIAMTFSFAVGSKITIFQRSLLMESIGTLHIGGVVKVIKRMLIGTLLLEGTGAAILAIKFIPLTGFWQGLWFGIFHSVSAFCNAGFDITGKFAPYGSLNLFNDDLIINITVMVLIVSGGIGFIVWNDIVEYKFKFKKYALHCKIMITFTAGLILFGALGFYILEGNGAFANMGTGQRILSSFFASITPRTAGFTTVDLTTMTTGGRFLTMFLMFIGAGSGSTGGGIKVTTFVTLILALISYAKNYNDLSIFKRRLKREASRKAFSSISSYIAMILLCVFCLLIANPTIPPESCMFEAISAIGTVGLSLGLTPTLGVFSKLCLITLMYCGRLGSIAVAMAFARRKIIPKISYPEEQITVG